MNSLFEPVGTLAVPFECFIFDTKKENFPIRPHWHYFAEMIYVLEGTATMYDWEHKYTVSQGEFIFFHPKSVHSIYSTDDKPLTYIVIKFDINKLSVSPSYCPKFSNIIKCGADNNMQIYFDKKFCDKNNCKKLFESCVNEIDNKSFGYDLMIESNLYNILMLIIRKWQENDFVFDNNKFTKDTDYNIDNITEYIDQHIQEPIEVNDIATLCGISYSCFAKKFKKIYGFSCKEYIERFRVCKVEDYLLFTDFDLTYISQETGYSDCSHMIKQFKKYRGTTPKQFRLKGVASAK